MPIDKRRESKVIAVIEGVVNGAGPAGAGDLQPALERVNRLFYAALAEPFSATAPDHIDGVLSEPSRVPACLSVLRESLVPHVLRIGVGVGAMEYDPEAGASGSDVYSLARRALRLVIRDDGLTRYLGTGEAGDVLLSALCRLVDPLIRARSDKQWQAVAAYRELGHQQAVADRLGVTRQSVGDRLMAGHRRDVDDADEAVATFLGLLGRQRLRP
jgi:hypothetical protein